MISEYINEYEYTVKGKYMSKSYWQYGQASKNKDETVFRDGDYAIDRHRSSHPMDDDTFYVMYHGWTETIDGIEYCFDSVEQAKAYIAEHKATKGFVIKAVST